MVASFAAPPSFDRDFGPLSTSPLCLLTQCCFGTPGPPLLRGLPRSLLDVSLTFSIGIHVAVAWRQNPSKRWYSLHHRLPVRIVKVWRVWSAFYSPLLSQPLSLHLTTSPNSHLLSLCFLLIFLLYPTSQWPSISLTPLFFLRLSPLV